MKQALMADFGELSVGKNKQQFELTTCSNLLQLIASVFNTISGDTQLNKSEDEALTNRALDFISLMTSFGLIDAFSVFFSNIRGPLDDDTQNNDILQNSLNFLISITKFILAKKSSDIFTERKCEDSTQLIGTFKATNLVNIVSMLYGMLHKDASTPVKYEQSNSSHVNTKKLHRTTLELTTLCIKLLNNMIVIDLNMVQVSFEKHRRLFLTLRTPLSNAYTRYAY